MRRIINAVNRYCLRVKAKNDAKNTALLTEKIRQELIAGVHALKRMDQLMGQLGMPRTKRRQMMRDLIKHEEIRAEVFEMMLRQYTQEGRNGNRTAGAPRGTDTAAQAQPGQPAVK